MPDTTLLRFDPDAESAEDELCANLKQLVSGKLLVQAGSGAGKSWLVRYMLEETYGDIQHIVFDPERQLTTLRQEFGYLLVGSGEDLDAAPESAGALARGVMELEASVICDLADVTRAERYTFVAGFLRALIDLPDALRRPLLLVVDEAHQFAPEAERTASRAALEDVATRGRIRGLGLVAVTQRLSLLSKTVVSQCDNRLVGRTTLGNDLRRAAGEMGFSASERTEIRKLRTGEFFAFGPAISFEVVKVRSGDVITRHVEPGEVAPPAPPPPEEMKEALASLREGMEAQDISSEQIEKVDEGDQPGTTPSEAPASEAPASKVEESQQQIAKLCNENAALKDEARRWKHHEAALTGRISELEAALELVRTEAREALSVSVDAEASADEVPLHLIDNPERNSPQRNSPQSNGHLPDARRRILAALRRFEALGTEQMSRQNLAVFSSQSPKSSAYTAHLSEMRSVGLISYPAGGMVALTEDGRAAAPSVSAPASVEALHAAWKRYVPDAQRRIIEALIEAHPDSYSRDELAAASRQSAKSSAYTDHLATLRQLGVAEYPRPGYVVAGAVLYPSSP